MNNMNKRISDNEFDFLTLPTTNRNELKKDVRKNVKRALGWLAEIYLSGRFTFVFDIHKEDDYDESESGFQISGFFSKDEMMSYLTEGCLITKVSVKDKPFDPMILNRIKTSSSIIPVIKGPKDYTSNEKRMTEYVSKSKQDENWAAEICNDLSSLLNLKYTHILIMRYFFLTDIYELSNQLNLTMPTVRQYENNALLEMGSGNIRYIKKKHPLITNEVIENVDYCLNIVLLNMMNGHYRINIQPLDIQQDTCLADYLEIISATSNDEFIESMLIAISNLHDEREKELLFLRYVLGYSFQQIKRKDMEELPPFRFSYRSKKQIENIMISALTNIAIGNIEFLYFTNK